MSAGSVLEGYIVVSARTYDRVSDFLQLLADLDLRIMAFDEQQLTVARDAFDRYGKGRHPARLNFGDCISYALAKAEGLPLLFKGEDFVKTDVEIA